MVLLLFDLTAIASLYQFLIIYISQYLVFVLY
jgi:hypothetical protein